MHDGLQAWEKELLASPVTLASEQELAGLDLENSVLDTVDAWYDMETQRDYANRMFGHKGHRWCYDGEHCGQSHPIGPTHEVHDNA